MAAPAFTTRSVNGSINAAASSRPMMRVFGAVSFIVASHHSRRFQQRARPIIPLFANRSTPIALRLAPVYQACNAKCDSPRSRGFLEIAHVRHIVRSRSTRTRGAAVLARLPRSHQPGRRHRQRPRGPGRQSQAGRPRIRARSDPEERQDRLRPAAVLPARLRRRRFRRRPDRSRRRRDDGARPYRGRQDHDRLESAAPAAAEEPGQAAAQHAGDRAADDSARRHADRRSDRRGRDHGLPRHRDRPQCAGAADHRRPARRSSRMPPMPMRCSLTIRGCLRRPAA